MYHFVIEKYNRLVGDNIDYEIYARVQSQQHCNRSIHWTHQFAVLDRVQDPQLDRFSSQKPVSEIQLAAHEYSKEMSQKSDSVSSSLNTVCAVKLFLGLLTLPNSNLYWAVKNYQYLR